MNNTTPLHPRQSVAYFQISYEVVTIEGAKYDTNFCTYAENSAAAIDKCRAEAQRKYNYKSIWIKNIN